MNDKCIECGRKEGDILTFDNNRRVAIKLVNSRYGKLCQRHVSNVYARQMTAKKRTKRQREEREALQAAGQLDMFAGMEGGE